MSKGNTFENEWLLLVFNNVNIANIGDATGLRGSSTAGNLYISLHTSDPGEGGNQSTNECTYTSYARVAVARDSGSLTVTGSSVSPASAVAFPAATGGSETATHFVIGTSSSGTGKLLYKGAISPTIAISSGVTPRLTTGTTITED